MKCQDHNKDYSAYSQELLNDFAGTVKITIDPFKDIKKQLAQHFKEKK